MNTNNLNVYTNMDKDEDEARVFMGYFTNIDNPPVNVEWIAGIKKHIQKSYDTACDTYLRYKEYNDEYDNEKGIDRFMEPEGSNNSDKSRSYRNGRSDLKDLFCENSYVAKEMLRCALPFEDCNKDLAMSLYLSYKTQAGEIEKFITNQEKQGHFMGGARHDLKVTKDAIEQAFESVSLFGKWRNDVKTKVVFLMK